MLYMKLLEWRRQMAMKAWNQSILFSNSDDAHCEWTRLTLAHSNIMDKNNSTAAHVFMIHTPLPLWRTAYLKEFGYCGCCVTASIRLSNCYLIVPPQQQRLAMFICSARLLKRCRKLVMKCSQKESPLLFFGCILMLPPKTWTLQHFKWHELASWLEDLSRLYCNNSV